MLPRGPRQDRGTEALHHPTKRGTQQDQPLPMLLANRERKPTRKEGTQRKKGSDKPTSPQAHKERGTPPHRRGAGSLSPHHKFAPKNQQKVALGRFEKIFGKIFRGNVSGERKTPCVVSTEGVLTNENREISNLAMQVTKNAQKHYSITDGKGR